MMFFRPLAEASWVRQTPEHTEFLPQEELSRRGRGDEGWGEGRGEGEGRRGVGGEKGREEEKEKRGGGEGGGEKGEREGSISSKIHIPLNTQPLLS